MFASNTLNGKSPIKSAGRISCAFTPRGVSEVLRLKSHLYLVLASLFVLSTTAPALSLSLTVKTFNIRNDNQSAWTDSEPNAIFLRRDRVVDSIRENDPDIIALQEVTGRQFVSIRAELGPRYGSVYQPREPGDLSSEGVPIFYDTTRFDLLDSTSFWLSLLPDVPDTLHPLDELGDDDRSSRVATVVTLRAKDGGETFLVGNTHLSLFPDARRGLDWPDSALERLDGDDFTQLSQDLNVLETQPATSKFDGGDWRAKGRIPGQSEIFLATVEALAGDLPFILTGDLNTGPGLDGYELFTGNFAPGIYTSGDPLIDSLDSDNAGLTFHGNEPTELQNGDLKIGTNTSSPIDFIFTTSDFRTDTAAIERERYFAPPGSDALPVFPWKYASDHYAVSAELTLLAPTTPPTETVIPVPAGAPLLLTGLAALAVMRRRAR
ncbi:MAG: endonuclease/exonuclease/phosphatase family protein [Pseudomonadota bacterium]